MEAALRDYSNSFNSLQSVNQVWHPIILLRPPRLGRREEGEERSSVQLTAPPSNPESHELCGTAAAEHTCLDRLHCKNCDSGRCCGCRRGDGAL